MAGQCDILFNSFLMGLRMRTFNKAQSGRFTIVLLLIFALSMVVYYFSNGLPIKLSPTYKYSPNLLYILYGMFICGVFWTIRDLLKRLINYKITRIIEKHCMDLFILHSTATYPSTIQLVCKICGYSYCLFTAILYR